MPRNLYVNRPFKNIINPTIKKRILRMISIIFFVLSFNSFTSLSYDLCVYYLKTLFPQTLLSPGFHPSHGPGGLCSQKIVFGAESTEGEEGTRLPPKNLQKSREEKA